MLYAVFVVSFSGGNIFLDFFDQTSATLLIDGVGHLLYVASVCRTGWSRSLAGGVGGGLNLVFTFVPPIGLTFVFLALLEDSGYMARAAYAMDRLMRKMGLPGNALVPMIVGFGCNVPAIMGSRIIEDPRGRLLTVLMQPFMSCSARLTIYMAFAVVFFRENGGQVVFALYRARHRRRLPDGAAGRQDRRSRARPCPSSWNCRPIGCRARETSCCRPGSG